MELSCVPEGPVAPVGGGGGERAVRRRAGVPLRGGRASAAVFAPLAAGPVKRQVAVKSTRGFALKSTHGIAIKSTNMAAADKGESAPVRRTTRQFYDGEESCYIIDAKLEGNLGRYLNVSHRPRQGADGERPLAAGRGKGRLWGDLPETR